MPAISTFGLFGAFAAFIAVTVWTARGAAQRATCTARLRQIASALIMYRNENGAYPPESYTVWDFARRRSRTVTWETVLRTYVDDWRVFACPCDSAASTADDARHSYEYVAVESAARVGGSRAPTISKGRGYGSEVAADSGVLLVCRHHNRGQSTGDTRVLVAHDDGSVRWQPLPGSRIAGR
ncbi:MAG: type II secretion system protein [Armatimonadota bacterium]